MVDSVSSNNLISKAVSQIPQKDTNVSEPIIKEKTSDTFVKKEDINVELNNTNNSKKAIISKYMDILISGVIFAGIFLIPDLLLSMKRGRGVNYKEIKTFLKNYNTMNEKTLPNGGRRLLFDFYKGMNKYREIMIIDSNNVVKKRAFIKQEKMPNGRYMTTDMTSYVGNNLNDTQEVICNENKYLFKEYKRTMVSSNEYNVKIKRKKSPKFELFKYFTTTDGQIGMKVSETPKAKEYMAYLYDSLNSFIGFDKQIIPKNSSLPKERIVHIPTQNLFHKKANIGEIVYDTSYTKKLQESL